jgi:hypothetical protein
LYHKLNAQVAKSIDDDDLWLTDKSRGYKIYNPTNVWNIRSDTGSIMHLIHPSNTLGAEIDIAAQATVIRKDKQGKTIKSDDDLIRCSQYGNYYRSSDPTIGGSINAYARSMEDDGKGPYMLSVANPVALYIYSLDDSTLLLDYAGQDSSDQDLRPLPAGTIKVTRGDLTKHMGLRIEIEVPAGTRGTATDDDGNLRDLRVSDIFDSSHGKGNYIMYGAQFADHIMMSVSAVVIPLKEAAEPLGCPCDIKKAQANGVTNGAAAVDKKVGVKALTSARENVGRGASRR